MLDVHYWRDKRGHVIDFVMAVRGQNPAWGDDIVVAQDVDRAYARDYDRIRVRFVGLADLVAKLR
ncbi:MAG: hypothetical protein U1E76_24240 [Planctomycetota bacterium]